MEPERTYPPRGGISQSTRETLVQSLLQGVPPHDIASTCNVSLATVYRYAANILKYGSPLAPSGDKKLGRPRKLTSADEESLLELLLQEPWHQQDELAFWLWCERGALVSRWTVSRTLKRHKWHPDELRAMALERSGEWREGWKNEMKRFVEDDVIFIDETVFNEKTGWRYRGYGPIGQDIRYSADMERGGTWSLCVAGTVNGWLPCKGIKEGYFNTEDFLKWVDTQLIPALTKLEHRPRLIVFDNISIHIDEEITEAVEEAGFLVRFLPPYSPDFNPIELSFSVLKAWFYRNFMTTRNLYGSFGDYLVWSIEQSQCDRFVREQFKHDEGGLYLEEGELQRFYEWISAWEHGAFVEEVVEIRKEDIEMALEAGKQASGSLTTV
jgi:transposase